MAEDKEASNRGLPVVDDRQLELFKQFVAVQKDQIDLKGKEVALREKELAVEEGNRDEAAQHLVQLEEFGELVTVGLFHGFGGLSPRAEY
jgi:hypothetical protein